MLVGTSANRERSRAFTAERGTRTTAPSSTVATSSLPSRRSKARRIATGMTTRPFGPTETKEVSLTPL